jgi:hypothetical protein
MKKQREGEGLMSRKVQAQGGRPRSLPGGTRWRWQIKAKVLARGVAATPGACSSSTMRKLRHVEGRKRKRSIAGGPESCSERAQHQGVCAPRICTRSNGPASTQLSKERAFTMGWLSGTAMAPPAPNASGGRAEEKGVFDRVVVGRREVWCGLQGRQQNNTPMQITAKGKGVPLRGREIWGKSERGQQRHGTCATYAMGHCFGLSLRA